MLNSLEGEKTQEIVIAPKSSTMGKLAPVAKKRRTFSARKSHLARHKSAVMSTRAKHSSVMAAMPVRLRSAGAASKGTATIMASTRAMIRFCVNSAHKERCDAAGTEAREERLARIGFLWDFEAVTEASALISVWTLAVTEASALVLLTLKLPFNVGKTVR